ncbi:MAG TPA: NAD(+)/NADH kinase [Solirubrobacteraceae bacterium]|nr:NAD(+)/NADH kinase [Solirubrobacteraceae bacterium]
MSEVTALPLPEATAVATTPRAHVPRTVGLVVHPSRSVEQPLRVLREWAEEHGTKVVQAPASCNQRRVADEGDPAQSDLIVSIGGDGTTLAALRTGAVAGRPVLGIACGSLGALATVSVRDARPSLERFSRGEWHPRRFPALSIDRGAGADRFALNDVTVLRSAGGQVRMTVRVNGGIYARIAGDGAVISTPIGSSGYGISAGGPLLASALEGFVFTPLPKHGGFAPPLVVDAATELVLEVTQGFGGGRLEIDGQVADEHVGSLRIGLQRDVATMVAFPDQESLLAGLRRRGIILDSPRMVVDADRALDSGAP